jgi:hypothetical protein
VLGQLLCCSLILDLQPLTSNNPQADRTKPAHSVDDEAVIAGLLDKLGGAAVPSGYKMSPIQVSSLPLMPNQRSVIGAVVTALACCVCVRLSTSSHCQYC